MEEQPTKKGPKPKADAAEVEKLIERMTKLEELVIRMCHNSGTAHSLILKAGLEPYSPSKAEMTKYASYWVLTYGSN